MPEIAYTEKPKDKRFIELTGKKFTRLLVVEYLGQSQKRHSIWLCKCDCGNTIVTYGFRLLRGSAKSCGCYRRDSKYKHGLIKTRFYHIWESIKNRCKYPTNNRWSSYGGRGIKFCEYWDDFVNFRDDMYETYLAHAKKHGEKNTTIERIDVNGDYEPINCKWVTRQEQMRNTTKNVHVTINGEKMILAQALRKFNVHDSVYYSLIKKGWNAEDIFLTKSKKAN